MSFGVTRGASTNGSAENQGDGDAPLPKTRMAPWTAARDNSWQMVETPTLEDFDRFARESLRITTVSSLEQALKILQSGRATGRAGTRGCR